MRRLIRLLMVGGAVGLLMALTAPAVWGGEGTYNEGTPDKLTLNVVFMYPETAFNPNTDWQNAFTRASQLLYNSTDGQVQIGTVNFYNNCPEMSDKADFLIHSGEGRGYVTGLGGLGTRGVAVHLYDGTHTKNVAAARGHFGIVHELGHYVFALHDEYFKNYGAGQRNIPRSCISAASTVASIMDGGTTCQPENQRTEWSHPTYRNACTDTVQMNQTGMTCWPYIVKYAREHYTAVLTTPAALDQTMPAGHQALTFNYYDCKVRAVVCLDRSGSMSGSKMDTAKAGAKLFVDQTRVTTRTVDELGVSSYADLASINYAIAVMSDTNKTVAKNAINGLVASGLTNIGGGLQTSLNMITGRGDPVSNEVIVLLSDGQHNTGTHPNDVIPALKARGVVVYTIGIGDADAALMRSIATQTGGKYYYTSGTAGLQAFFNTIFTEMRNDGMTTKLNEKISTGQMRTHTVYIDAYTTAAGEATFILSWDSGDVDLTLKRPNGTTVADSDPDVLVHVEDTLSEMYRMNDPPTGNWTVQVDGVSVSGQAEYDLQVNSVASSNVAVVVTTDQDSYTLADAALVRASVIAPVHGGTEGHGVMGATVSVAVRMGDTVVSTFQLYDDGAASHGDEVPNDGLYSNYFSGYAGEGSYEFDVTVVNQSGTMVPPDEKWPEFPDWDGPPVDPFTRRAAVTVNVEPANVYLPLVLRGLQAGFDSQFNGSAPGWESHSGTWTVDSNYYRTTGLADASSSASYVADFTNFDYEVRLWRSGCDGCANRLFVRGTPTPLGSGNRWYSYYGFQYTRGGSYSVWKRVAGGDVTALQEWTSSSAINQGDAWNTMRVVASGSSLDFYINGTLVWSGWDSSLTSGRVGVGMYRSSSSSGDQFFVDWATLSPLSITGLDVLTNTGTVGAEQRGLNDATDGREGGDNESSSDWGGGQ